MPEKSVEEMLDEIQQVLMENTNKLSTDEDVFCRDLLLFMSIENQKKFFTVRSSFDEMKEYVKEFHKNVLATRV